MLLLSLSKKENTKLLVPKNVKRVILSHIQKVNKKNFSLIFFSLQKEKIITPNFKMKIRAPYFRKHVSIQLLTVISTKIFFFFFFLDKPPKF